MILHQLLWLTLPQCGVVTEVTPYSPGTGLLAHDVRAKHIKTNLYLPGHNPHPSIPCISMCNIKQFTSWIANIHLIVTTFEQIQLSLKHKIINIYSIYASLFPLSLIPSQIKF